MQSATSIKQALGPRNPTLGILTNDYTSFGHDKEYYYNCRIIKSNIRYSSMARTLNKSSKMYNDTHFDIVIRWTMCIDINASKTLTHKIKIGEHLYHGSNPVLSVLEYMGTEKRSKMIYLNIHMKELTQKPRNCGPLNKCHFLKKNPIT